MQVVLISLYSRAEATGLRILSAVLKRSGFATRMIFLPNVQDTMISEDFGAGDLRPEVLQQIVDLCRDAALIGIGLMTANFTDARLVTKALHAAGLGPVIWGGIHPTVCPDECLQYADLVCVGEGEHCLVELARRIAAGTPYLDIPNLGIVNSDGAVRINPLHPLECDLDALPFPDYESEQHFVLHSGKFVPFSDEVVYYHLADLGSWARGPVYPIFTGRGCPYRCTYCVNDALARVYPGWNQVRQRTPANVIAEIQAIRHRLPQIGAINLRDDTFLANSREYIAEFSQRYAAEVGLPFRAYTTSKTADPVKLSLLVDAGLRQVIMGIQTGSTQIQRLYGRTANNDDVLRAAAILHSFQARMSRPIYDLITDNPYETRADRYATLDLVHRLPRPYRLSLYSLTFFPGTELRARARTDGLVREGTDDVHHRNIEAIEANYYNFALFCHSLQLSQPFLNLLHWRPAFDLLSRQPLSRSCGWLLRVLLQLRLISNRSLYLRRRWQWRVTRGRAEHV